LEYNAFWAVNGSAKNSMTLIPSIKKCRDLLITCIFIFKAF